MSADTFEPDSFQFAIVLIPTAEESARRGHACIVPDVFLQQMWRLLQNDAPVFLLSMSDPFHVIGYSTLATVPILSRGQSVHVLHVLRKRENMDTWAHDHLETARRILEEKKCTDCEGLVTKADYLFRLVPEDVIDHTHSKEELIYLILCAAYSEERVHLPIFLRRLRRMVDDLNTVDVSRVFNFTDFCPLSIAGRISERSAIVAADLRYFGVALPGK